MSATVADTLPLALPLTDAQVAAFRHEGVLVANGLLSEADLQPVRDEIAEWIDRRARELLAAGKITELHADAPFTRRFGLLMAQCGEIQDGFDVVPLHGRALFRFLHTPRLLDALAQLIGPELSLNPIHHLRAKPPQEQCSEGAKGYFSVPWHQDSGVTLAEADASEIVTTWLPLGDATEEMGCLQVLPGANRLGHLPHVAVPGYGTSVKPSAMPKIQPRKLPVHAGDVVFMHRHTPHHSTPNRSHDCRWSLDLRFQRTGDHNGRPWQPDFVVRSPSGLPLADYDAWVRRWQEALAKPDGWRVAHRLEAE
jgi:phytanoyl-CoA hydroxylase